MLKIEPGATGWEASMLSLCYEEPMYSHLSRHCRRLCNGQSNIQIILGGWQSTEVAVALLTQPSRVRFWNLTAGKMLPPKLFRWEPAILKKFQCQCTRRKNKKQLNWKIDVSEIVPSLKSVIEINFDWCCLEWEDDFQSPFTTSLKKWSNYF